MTSYILKVKTKEGHAIIKDLTSTHTIYDLKSALLSITNIPLEFQNILYGYPRKPLDISENSKQLGLCGIVSGEILIVDEKKSDQVTANSENSNLVQNKQILNENNDKENLENTSSLPGILLKNEVPADNSCLFTSVNYVMSGKVDLTVGSYLRQLIAETIKNDNENYSEAILGKPIDEYCQWIQKPESWGGAIELSILANYFGVEIAVVDTLNAIINRFGEDKRFPHRAFLIFDGIHYDPLYLEPFYNQESQTIFPTNDDTILQLAENLAQTAKLNRQFTDVNNFRLKCLVCNTILTGEAQAQVHAKQTKHTNFGEVD